VKVLSTTDAAASTTVLRMEVEDFAQNFDSATSSKGVLVRASVFRNHRLVEQKTFSSSVARRAPMPPAAPAPGRCQRRRGRRPHLAGWRCRRRR
jgi:cholesterol transport system auxiliary component